MGNKIDKAQVRRRFARHLGAYDGLAVVQQRIAATLAGVFAGYAPARFADALEIGCGTGFLTRELLRTSDIGTLYLNDLVPEALPVLRERLGREGVLELPGDAEQVAMPGGLELVASASTMQWFEDLEAFFARTAGALKAGGWFVFNLFGADNLHQIKALTGNGLDYLTADELRRLLGNHFEIKELREETITQEFDAPFDVLRHLQQTGVTATGEFRWTAGKLRAFEQEYINRYGSGDKVTLDWDVIYVVARKNLENCGESVYL